MASSFRLLSTCLMSACLDFNDILEVGRPQIEEMQRIGNSYASADVPGACDAFTRQVRFVEGVIVYSYGVAVALARKSDDLKEGAGIWSKMSQFCLQALEVLRELKHKYPYCGTPQLYDVVLDYKLAADKRYQGVSEEITCQKTEFPKGLLPDLS